MKNYLHTLGLTEDAGPDEIKQAYRRLAKQYHPDVNKSPDAQSKFCEISEAYEFLTEHWPLHEFRYTGEDGTNQKYNQHQKTDIYEQFRKEAQERAHRQARMRYEKFQKQHEAFQESGLNDLALLFTMLMRVLSVFLFIFLVLTPLLLALFMNWVWIFTIFFLWPFAIGIGWYYRDNKKHYFFPGKLYYSPGRIRHLFTDKHPTQKACFYSRGKNADSKPYKFDLFKLKDVKIGTGGFRQHSVNYVNQSLSVSIPRSRKAFTIHTMSIAIKILSVTGSLIFLDISSIPWRFIAGLFIGGLLTRFLLIFTRTRSNITYLYSRSLIIRVALWITGVTLASKFYMNPFDIYSKEIIYFAIASIILFDCLFMQLISMLLGKQSSYPVFDQYPELMNKFREGYIVYNDIPVISFAYPLLKWIFG